MAIVGANYLRQLRFDRFKTLREVSEDIGVSIALLCKLEKGQTSLTKDVAQKLANYYGVTIKPVKTIKRFEEDVYIEKTPEYKIKNQKLSEENRILKSKLKYVTQRLQIYKNTVDRMSQEIDAILNDEIKW